MTSFRGFSVLTVTTVTLASSALEASRFGFVEPRLIAGLALIYALALYIRELNYKPETTFFDADHGVQLEKQELIVFGEGIEDLAQESKERRLLMDLVYNGGRSYKIYFSWILTITFAVLLQSRFRPLTFTDVIVPTLILSAITFSPFLSQLLIPTAVGLGIALIAIARSESLMVVFYFVLFLISFFLTLYVYREVTPDRLNSERKTKLPSVLKAALSLTALFIGLYLAFDFIVPEENPFKRNASQRVQKPSKFSTDRLSREIADQILKHQEGKSDESSPDVRSEAGRQGEPTSVKPNKRVSDGPENSREQTDRQGVNDGVSTEPGVQTGDERGTGHPSNSGDGTKNSSQQVSDRQGVSDGASTQRKDAAEDRSASENEAGRGDQTGRGDGTGRGKGTGRTADHRDDNRSGKSEGAGKDLGSTTGEGSQQDQAAGANRENESARSDSEQTKAENEVGKPEKVDPRAREKKIEELKRKFELPIEIGKALLFLIIAGSALPLLFKLISKWKERPQDDVKMQQLTAKQKKKLQSILHQIRARALAPEAEVIETYNALLAVFEMGQHPREEWLPAEDFSMKITGTIPPLAKPFQAVTNRFSRTLYGKKAVAPEDLGVFRTEVGRILQFFQVT